MRKTRGLIPRRGPLPFRYVFLLSFVFFMFSTAAGLFIVDKGIEPTLIDIAESETKRIATLVIKNAVNQQIVEEEIDRDDLIITEYDREGKLVYADVNSNVVNEFTTRITANVEKYLRYVNDGDIDKLEFQGVDIERDDNSEEGGFIYEIPLGQATNNTLLGNLGPKIPIRFHMIGDVIANPEKEFIEKGINNIIIDVYVTLKVTVRVIMPFSTEEIEVVSNVPITNPMIPGDVPQFYNNGGESSPSIEVPID